MATAAQTAQTRLFSGNDLFADGVRITDDATVILGGRTLALASAQDFGASLFGAEVLDGGGLAFKWGAEPCCSANPVGSARGRAGLAFMGLIA